MLTRGSNGATMLRIMSLQPLRSEAVAGSWYPDRPAVLAAEVDRFLSEVSDTPPAETVLGLVAPHAGLMYSGPVAAWAYRAVQGGPVSYTHLRAHETRH